MIGVSIINVTSYTGLELLRLLSLHPEFALTSVTGRSAAGKCLDEVFPQLHALWMTQNNAQLSVVLRHEAKDVLPSPQSNHPMRWSRVNPQMVIGEEAEPADLAFVCLPHAAAAEAVVGLLERGTKVVDLSADFRLKDVGVYEQWYKHSHPAPAVLETAAYGLPELGQRQRDAIDQTELVANPGCYATAAILALAPALTAGLIEPDVIVDGKSGVSGAGRSPSLTTHYAEANEDVSAYSLAGHRHLPEIMQECSRAAAATGQRGASQLRMTFIPHLVPMTRGILATCYAPLKRVATIPGGGRPASGAFPTAEAVYAAYQEYYAGEPFVHVVDQAPHTKWSYGSNHCFIHPVVDRRAQRLVVISCLDNLIKGAAGQAIQNANRLCGLPETTGLVELGIVP